MGIVDGASSAAVSVSSATIRDRNPGQPRCNVVSFCLANYPLGYNDAGYDWGRQPSYDSRILTPGF